MYSRFLKYTLLIAAAISFRIATAEETVPTGISGNLTVSGCIIDNDNNFDQIAPSVTVSYSIVRGATAPSGVGNMALSDNTVIADSIASPHSAHAYYLSNLSPLINVGSPTLPAYMPEKDINGNIRNYNGRVDIGAVEYSMVFDRDNGSWNSSANWNIDRVPDKNDVITILKTATVDDTNAVGKSIIAIQGAGKLIINPSSQLNVTNTINNTEVDKLVIKASPTSSNGTLIFHNPYNFPVYASVEMYSMANRQIAGTDTTYRWQYVGIPLKSVTASPTLDGSWVRSLNESSIKYDKWETLKGSSILRSFSGYEITQHTEKTFTFKGVLENRDTTIVLGKSSVPYYAGQHLLANPYTAAMKISDLTFGANTEATVYVYNTGSYDDWNVDNTRGRVGDNRGQYTAVPKNTAYLIYPAIPSMQGFIVRATNNAGSITIPYTSNTQNIVKQKVKSKVQNNYLAVNLSSQHHNDHVWLLHEPTATKEFDNGWDGYKLIANNNDAILYAKEAAGDFQVNTVNDFNNLNLNFKAGKDIDYELTIVNHGIDKVYPEIYLIDLTDNKVIIIEGDTVRYAFTANNTQKSENRFRVMTGRNQEFNPVDDELISIYLHAHEQTIKLYNATGETGSYMLYDIAGRMLENQQLMPGLNSIACKRFSGVIVVKATAGSESKTWKMVLNN